MSWQEDYDYPMSWAFWRDACKLHTGRDPGPEVPPKRKPERDKDLAEIKEILLELKELLKEKPYSPQKKEKFSEDKKPKKSKGVAV